MNDDYPEGFPSKFNERGSANPARALRPHPDHGDLPPCEHHRGTEPCKQDATHQYSLSYLCDEHYALHLAENGLEDAELDLRAAKRFLWQAHEHGSENLEYEAEEVYSRMNADVERARSRLERAKQEVGE